MPHSSLSVQDFLLTCIFHTMTQQSIILNMGMLQESINSEHCVLLRGPMRLLSEVTSSPDLLMLHSAINKSVDLIKCNNDLCNILNSHSQIMSVNSIKERAERVFHKIIKNIFPLITTLIINSSKLRWTFPVIK